jgi:hypothetical protein
VRKKLFFYNHGNDRKGKLSEKIGHKTIGPTFELIEKGSQLPKQKIFVWPICPFCFQSGLFVFARVAQKHSEPAYRQAGQSEESCL